MTQTELNINGEISEMVARFKKQFSDSRYLSHVVSNNNKRILNIMASDPHGGDTGFNLIIATLSDDNRPWTDLAVDQFLYETGLKKYCDLITTVNLWEADEARGHPIEFRIDDLPSDKKDLPWLLKKDNKGNKFKVRFEEV